MKNAVGTLNEEIIPLQLSQARAVNDENDINGRDRGRINIYYPDTWLSPVDLN
jgi:hypothetical protein